MEIIETKNILEFRIDAQHNWINQIVCFILGVITSLLGIGGLFIETEFIGLNLSFLLIMFFISHGYWRGFVWNIKGVEIMKIFRDGTYDFKKNPLCYKRKGKIFDNQIGIFDKNKDPSDPPPRSDGYIGSYGGRIIIWYYPINNNKPIDLTKMPLFFRFGKSITSEDADLIVDKIKQFLN